MIVSPRIVAKPGPARRPRAIVTLLAGMLLLAAVGVGMPATASAHDGGHSCNGGFTGSGFYCSTLSSSKSLAIYLYYNGTERGVVRVTGTTPGATARICDSNPNDAIRPNLRVREAYPVYLEWHTYYSPSSGGCWDRTANYYVKDLRAFNRNLSGDVNHGTIYYDL